MTTPELYTPTTEQLKVCFRFALLDPEVKASDVTEEDADRFASKSFDRWLAQHDAEVKARELREAAQQLMSGTNPDTGDEHALEIALGGIDYVVWFLTDRADRR